MKSTITKVYRATAVGANVEGSSVSVSSSSGEGPAHKPRDPVGGARVQVSPALLSHDPIPSPHLQLHKNNSLLCMLLHSPSLISSTRCQRRARADSRHFQGRLLACCTQMQSRTRWETLATRRRPPTSAALCGLQHRGTPRA